MRYFPKLGFMFGRQQELLVEATPSNVVSIGNKTMPAIPKSITTGGAESLIDSVSSVDAAKPRKEMNNNNDNNKPEETKQMAEHKEEKRHDHDNHHHHKDCCCEAVVIPVVIKVFDFCAEKHYILKKFEEYIVEYYDMYPSVLFKWKKEYCDPHCKEEDEHKYKCRVRFCVYFSLLDYDKAFEIETSLQKKYRHYLLRH